MRQIFEDDLTDEALLKCPHAGLDKRTHARTLYTHARTRQLTELIRNIIGDETGAKTAASSSRGLR